MSTPLTITLKQFIIYHKRRNRIEEKGNFLILTITIYDAYDTTLIEKDHLGDWSPEKDFSGLQSPR